MGRRVKALLAGPARTRRRLRIGLVAVAVALVVAGVVSTSSARQPTPAPSPPSRGIADTATAYVRDGRTLFLEGCASCHGSDAGGLAGIGPSLRGVGAAAADFYLTTGRMPLSAPGDQPLRARPRYGHDDIDRLTAYIAHFGGEPVPRVDPARGNLSEGQHLFTSHCSGCHQVAGRGGIAPGGFAPSLTEATPEQVGEAIRVGPYIMPRFSHATISDDEIDSIARYVEYTKQPDNAGGWDIGLLGPIPEGLIAWLLAAAVLLLIARVIGERTTDELDADLGHGPAT